MHNTVSWFSQRVAKSQHGIFSEIVTITPEMAKHILEKNPNNRFVNHSTVRQYAADLKFKRWSVNGEPIIIANTGEVNDGQHRLLAIIAADKPLRTNMTFGPERDSRLTVDMGRARKVTDFLGMEGAKNGNLGAAASRMLITFRKGIYSDGGGRQGHLTSAEVREEYWKNQEEIDAATHYVKNNSFTKMYGGSALVVTHVIISRKNKDDAEYFFNKLKTGDSLVKGDVILMMRSKMMDMRQDRMRPWEKTELFLRYWNAWRAGGKLSRAIILRKEWPEVSN